MYRDHTKVIQIGNRKMGGGNPYTYSVYDQYKDRGCAGNRRSRSWPWRLQDVTLSAVRCRTMEAAKAL